MSANNFVSPYETRYYEVHPRNLSWAMHDLAQQPGCNVQGYAQGDGGMFIIIVRVPAGAPQTDWRSAPQRKRTQWDISPRLIGVLVTVALFVAVVGYAAYSGASLPTWGELTANVHMPWDAPLPQGESATVSRPKAQAHGFRWPWQDAQDAAGAAVGTITTAGMMVLGLVALVAVLWLIGLVRKAVGK